MQTKKDINFYNYWLDEDKKVLRQARKYGLNINEIKQYGESIKKLRLKIKQLETQINK
jgi:hypothetical protein